MMEERVLVPVAVLCHSLALFSLNVPIDRHTLYEIHSLLHNTRHHNISDLWSKVKTHVRARVRAQPAVAANSLSVRVHAKDLHTLEEVSSVMVVSSLAAFRSH